MLSLALDGSLLILMRILLVSELLDEVLVAPCLLQEVADGDRADPMYPSYIGLSVMLHQYCMRDINLLSSGELGYVTLLVLATREVEFLHVALIISESILLLLTCGSIQLQTHSLLQLHLLVLLYVQNPLYLLSTLLDLLTDASYG